MAKLRPESSFGRVSHQLKTVDEILALYLAGENFPSTAFETIEKHARQLRTPGIVLEESAFAEIRSTCLAYQHLFSFCENRKPRLPVLFSDIENLPPEPEILDEINKILDERGEVRSHASPELARIRRELEQKRIQAARTFERALKKYRDKGWLADFDETIFEHRRVLAVQAGFKNQVSGIFHGSSSKGNVLYIEPGEAVESNNLLAQLKDEEKQEIRRILKTLGDKLRPHVPHLIYIEENLVHLDFVRAKALFAKSENCCLPQISDSQKEIILKEAYNPVLSILNKEKGKGTIPLDLQLDGNQRILVISGPNAGGKSIALKTLGLLTLMLQSGILVPVHPASRFFLFGKLFADIGDSQSIENELSTYSSKLQKMRHFLAEADENTLLLIDEFGSGSDPELGSALAQVFLEKLNSFKVFGIFTTHYNAIKALAANLPGVRNSAMLFNKRDLTPEYRLEIGNPGSSYTFEVAGQSGIPPHLIKEARGKTSENTLKVDKLLVELQDDKLQLEKKHSRLNSEISKLKKLQNEQQTTIKKLEEKLSKQSRQNEQNDRMIFWGQKFQKLVEGWREQSGKKDKKQVVGRFIAMLNQRGTETEKEEKKAFSKKQSQRDRKINELKKEDVKIGDSVKVLSNNLKGTVSQIKNDNYTIILGNNIATTLSREKFIPAKADVPEKPQRKKGKK